MPEFDVPGSVAVFHNLLDYKRHVMSFRITNVHPSGLTFASHQDEIVFGNGGSHHRIGFCGRRGEGFGSQMFLFFQIQ